MAYKLSTILFRVDYCYSDQTIPLCPPSGTHRYFFKVYALDTLLDLDDSANKQMVEQALQDHVIAYGELIGLYKKT